MEHFSEPIDTRQCWHTGCVSLAVGRGLCAKHHTYYKKHGWAMPKDAIVRHKLSAIDVEKRKATCLKCGPETDIKPHAGKAIGWVCHTKRIRSEEYKLKRRAATYGITVEILLALLAAQNNLCAICQTFLDETNSKQIHIDHNHKTNSVRGILCHKCNVGLGHFNDDPELLIAASRYLNERSF